MYKTIEEATIPRGKGDPDAYGYPGQKDEPTPVDWAISELNNAIITLEKHGGLGYVSELKQYRGRLQRIIDKAVRPF